MSNAETIIVGDMPAEGSATPLPGSEKEMVLEPAQPPSFPDGGFKAWSTVLGAYEEVFLSGYAYTNNL